MKTLALTASATLILLAGCSSTTAMEKPEGTYVITAKGDSRAEVLSDAKDKALEQCQEHDFASFTIVQQELLAPNDTLAKNRASDRTMTGATLDDDADMAAMVSDDGEYQLTWQIRCSR
ncbi:hypothetical protein [Gallaecimonas xiamenensis]|uniref:Lipoprotein n=1 Tax=Gallaecimonas xiamenensis 3-C-1 TaxID=745411 RepID=K2JCU2_9GAMM|nr:hypothetical protein [Gallaecimonas xiamenensis]EKE68434.1 hypothetical protein B3C1_17092 [Gallaecimonas xiamenensis 3-C-1]